MCVLCEPTNSAMKHFDTALNLSSEFWYPFYAPLAVE